MIIKWIPNAQIRTTIYISRMGEENPDSKQTKYSRPIWAAVCVHTQVCTVHLKIWLGNQAEKVIKYNPFCMLNSKRWLPSLKRGGSGSVRCTCGCWQWDRKWSGGCWGGGRQEREHVHAVTKMRPQDHPAGGRTQKNVRTPSKCCCCPAPNYLLPVFSKIMAKNT